MLWQEKCWVEKLKKTPGRVALPEYPEKRTVEAARLLLQWQVVKSILVPQGCEGLKDGKVVLFPNVVPDLASQLAQSLTQKYQAKKRPVDAAQLQSLAVHPLYQAGWLLEQGHVDAVVAGASHTTADVIRAALQTVGLAAGVRTVSGAFLLTRESKGQHEILLFADCGVIIVPTEEQLLDIAYAAAQTWGELGPQGVAAQVAFLSFSTKNSASHPQQEIMQRAAQRFAAAHPGILSDGELQFDAAYVAEVRERKAPQSPLKAAANCFIFPDLNAGNISYKLAQRLGGFQAYGPILQGLARPYSDLSRGATAEEIAMAAVINMLRQKS